MGIGGRLHCIQISTPPLVRRHPAIPMQGIHHILLHPNARRQEHRSGRLRRAVLHLLVPNASLISRDLLPRRRTRHKTGQTCSGLGRTCRIRITIKNDSNVSVNQINSLHLHLLLSSLRGTNSDIHRRPRQDKSRRCQTKSQCALA